jgi:hypothetical protein
LVWVTHLAIFSCELIQMLCWGWNIQDDLTHVWGLGVNCQLRYINSPHKDSLSLSFLLSLSLVGWLD